MVMKTSGEPWRISYSGPRLTKRCSSCGGRRTSTFRLPWKFLKLRSRPLVSRTTPKCPEYCYDGPMGSLGRSALVYLVWWVLGCPVWPAEVLLSDRVPGKPNVTYADLVRLAGAGTEPSASTAWLEGGLLALLFKSVGRSESGFPPYVLALYRFDPQPRLLDTLQLAEDRLTSLDGKLGAKVPEIG